MPSATVLYFAGLRERVGLAMERVELPARATPAAILAALGELHPACGEAFACCRIAVDCDFIVGEVDIRDGAEVAVIHPVSGG